MYDALRGFLVLGIFITLGAVVSALGNPRDSDEFVVSVCGAGVGLTLTIGGAVLWRLTRPTRE